MNSGHRVFHWFRVVSVACTVMGIGLFGPGISTTLASGMSGCTAQGDPSTTTVTSSSTVCGMTGHFTTYASFQLAGTQGGRYLLPSGQGNLGVTFSTTTASHAVLHAAFSVRISGLEAYTFGFQIDGTPIPGAQQISGPGGSGTITLAVSLVAPTTFTVGSHQVNVYYTPAQSSATAYLANYVPVPDEVLTVENFGDASPTAVQLVKFHANRSADRVTFTWQVTDARAVSAFDVYAGKQRLNHHVIVAHQSTHYRFSTRWSGTGRFSLHVLATSGQEYIFNA